MKDDRFYSHRYDDAWQRLIWEPLLRNSTTLYPAARRDPIFTPLFTTILGAGGFSLGALGTISYAGLASFIATTALTYGLQMLLAPKPPKPEDGKAPLTQALPYRIYAVGRTRVAGARWLWEAIGAHLYSVNALAGHRIKAFNRFWLHDDEITFLTDGVTVAGQTKGRYANGRVKIWTRKGANPEKPYTEIGGFIEDLKTMAGANQKIWTPSHRGDGQATLAMLARNSSATKQQNRFPYGPPAPSVEGDWAYVWDYRDAAQDPADETTWSWSQNSALICAWHLCFNEFGFRLDYRKALLPVLDLWKEDADICDEDVPLAGGGTEKRYQCNGWDTAENGPKAGLNAILATCDGHLVARGDGARILTVGKFRESRCGTLDERDIIGYQIQDDVLFEDEINRLVPKFNYPATDYTSADTDYFEDVDAQLESGRVLSEDGNYQWCTQWRQARRLGIRDFRRIRQKVKGSLDVRLSGVNAIYYRWNRMRSPTLLPKLDGMVMENRQSVLAITKGGFTMQVVKNPDDIDAWNPAVDEGAQPPVPPAPNAADLVTPVINLVQSKTNGSNVYIRIVVIDPEDDSLTPVTRYRVHDADGLGTPGAYVEQEYPDAEPSGGYIDLATNVVPSNKLLDIGVAFKASNGKYSDWATTQVTSTVDTVAPAALLSFTQTGAAPHLGNAVFGYATDSDGHLRSVAIYRKATGVPLNVATDTPIASLFAAPSSSYAYTDGDATRTNLISDGDFATGPGPWSLGTGWSIGSGKATKAAGTGSSLFQTVTLTPVGTVFRHQYEASGVSAGNVQPRLLSGTTVSGTAQSADGTYRGKLTSASGNTAFGLFGSSSFVGSVDNVVLFAESASCAPQGVWDYYAVPFNASGVAGPASGPVTVTII